MSLETLLKNFGGNKTSSKPAAVVEQVKDGNAGTQFDSITDDSVCGKCGSNFFWKHKNWWFCGRCRKPPATEFIHDVRNGEFLLRRPKVAEVAKTTDRQQENIAAVEAYDSVIVVEGEDACPDCPCRWVKETPRDDGAVQRTCYTCKAIIPPGRHGMIRSQELPFYLLPFWKWFNER
jgi:ribosomal protein S27AE